MIALVNQVLLSRRIESRFLTLFLGVLSPDGRLTFCNAGQNPPLLFTRGGTRRLETGGTLIGAFLNATYDHEELQLRPGDTIVLFSDGDHGGDERGRRGVRRGSGSRTSFRACWPSRPSAFCTPCSMPSTRLRAGRRSMTT